MHKLRQIAWPVILLVIALSRVASAEQTAFRYPCYLVDAYDPEDDGWMGMVGKWTWPLSVEPYEMLVGPPPSAFSAVTMPLDHWVELQFSGPIMDGPGHDIIMIEIGRCGESVLVFLTDGAGREYLLDKVSAPDIGDQEPSEILLDISRADLPFEPRAVRILALDNLGGAPGFDLASVRARIRKACGPAACNPCPIDNARNVPPDAILTWLPGSSAREHTVYFGTSLEAVDANAAPISEPPQPQHPNSFEMGILELGRTYYWRIDEVSSAESNSPWPGEIWSFTVAERLVLEDFESYDSDSALRQAWEATGGAHVFASKAPDPVYRGARSIGLLYFYDLPFRSQFVHTLTSHRNWAAAGVKSIDLLLQGEPYNEPKTRLSLALGNDHAEAVIPYTGDPLNTTRESWTLWRIDLSSATDVNFSDIDYIAIGVTDDGVSEPEADDFSILYVDNITLHSTRCLPENSPPTDLTRDCAIDFLDVEEMSYTWLRGTPNIYPHQSPRTPPLAWYKFDGNTLDSSGNHYHGAPAGDANAVHNDPVRGLVLALDGHGDFVNITDAESLFSRIRDAVTITFWQRGTDSVHHTDTLCCSDYIYGLRDPAIAINLGAWRRPGRYNWDCGRPWSFDKGRLARDHRYDSQWTGHWNHWAFTKDTHAGTDPNTGIMNIYLNGELHDSRTDANSPISPVTSFVIGSGWYGGYDGLIDDFQIYDYALSQPEIVHVATEGSGVFDLPLMLPANLDGNGRIDFIDFAMLAGDWLDDHLWP